MKASISPSGNFPNAGAVQIPPLGHPARRYVEILPPGVLFEAMAGWGVVRDPDAAREKEKQRRAKQALSDLQREAAANGEPIPGKLTSAQRAAIDAAVEADPYWSTVMGYEVQVQARLFDGVPDPTLYGICDVPTIPAGHRLTAVAVSDRDTPTPTLEFTTEPVDPTEGYPPASNAQLNAALDQAIYNRAVANLQAEYQAVLREITALIAAAGLRMPGTISPAAEAQIKAEILAADLCGALPPAP